MAKGRVRGVAVAGFLAIDHPMLVPRLPAPGEAALVERLLSAGPRRGGTAAQIAGRLAAAGAITELLSFVGDDLDGSAYLDSLRTLGVGLSVTETCPDGTANAWLFYDRHGQTTAYLYPGKHTFEELTSAQRVALSQVTWYCVTAAPPHWTDEILDTADDDVRIAWCVKADDESFPPALVERIVRRADLITYNRTERAFIETPRGSMPLVTKSSALVVETNGVESVTYWKAGVRHSAPVKCVDCADTTGAGDALMAGILGCLSQFPDHLDRAVHEGIRSAAAHLRGNNSSVE